METNCKLEAKNNNKFYETVFISTVAAMSAIFGFGLTISMAKKKDPHFFSKVCLLPIKNKCQSQSHAKQQFRDGLETVSKSTTHTGSGGALAMKALGIGTLYAVTGVTAFSFVVWKALGVNDLYEFRQKVGSFLPKIPKKEPQGKSDFKSVRELMSYISEEGNNSRK